MKKPIKEHDNNTNNTQNARKILHSIDVNKMQPNPYSIRAGLQEKVLNFIHFSFYCAHLVFDSFFVFNVLTYTVPISFSKRNETRNIDLMMMITIRNRYSWFKAH